ncbi:unnamed protein product [Caenorhabditis sp. 36 PRJEB53466]|nr:unnamed protein product [Caenorhabditis sp. 36 PRJEB53466]
MNGIPGGPRLFDANSLFSSNLSLYKVAREYIPQEITLGVHANETKAEQMIYPADKGEAFVQRLLKSSDTRLRQYGSAKELRDNLISYSNFVDARDRFGMTYGAPYYLPPIVYKSVKNEEYICKADAFTYLQKWIFANHKQMEHLHIRYTFMLYMRLMEEEIGAYAEFVPRNCRQLKQLGPDFENVVSDMQKESPPMCKHTLNDYKNLTFAKLLKHWKTLIPFEWDDDEFITVEALLSFYYENLPRADAMEQTFISYWYLVKLFLSIERFIESRREVFHPFTKENTRKMKLTMRVFEDNGYHFAMVEEMLKMTSLSTGREPYTGGAELLHTRDVEPHSPCKLSKRGVEMLIVPIKRTKHGAVPIVTPSGDHCILMADAFLQCLHDVIITWKIFQKMKPTEWPVVKKALQRMELYDGPETARTVFMSLDHVKLMREAALEGFADLKDRPAKYIRNAKKDGFTVQNLKNELKHLGLVEIFPEIADHAEIAYEKVLKAKKEEHLRTCDLFDAVEHCQLLSFFKRFQEYTMLLHAQKSCKRVEGPQCLSCKIDSKIGQVHFESMGLGVSIMRL